jgi:DNA-binding transcriptional ArsR family regulator
MPLRDDTSDPAELAAIHDALGHRLRVRILWALRRSPRMPVAELRRGLRTGGDAPDTRTLMYHLQKMHIATLVDMVQEDGRPVVRLVRDVSVRTKLATP